VIPVEIARSGFRDARVALVTGAARGIGLGIAAWLLVEGWKVVLADVDAERGKVIVQALGESAAFVAMDVASDKQVAAGVAQALARFGRLDALVCNAAITSAHNGPLESLPLSRWQRVIDVNLTGTMLLARHCAPYLRARNGAIVNLCSTRAHQSEPDTEAYAASKGGVLALSHALAISLAPEIRVNVISPGWIDARDPAQRRSEPLTDADHAQHPTGRVGTVEDVAAATAWLLSSNAAFVTGQELIVDGGMTRKMIYA
jgi:NAD(P)-dependent dehydrogenase (short-subunit alcohol dehydrogenase family)